MKLLIPLFSLLSVLWASVAEAQSPNTCNIHTVADCVALSASDCGYRSMGPVSSTYYSCSWDSSTQRCIQGPACAVPKPSLELHLYRNGTGACIAKIPSSEMRAYMSAESRPDFSLAIEAVVQSSGMVDMSTFERRSLRPKAGMYDQPGNTSVLFTKSLTELPSTYAANPVAQQSTDMLSYVWALTKSEVNSIRENLYPRCVIYRGDPTNSSAGYWLQTSAQTPLPRVSSPPRECACPEKFIGLLKKYQRETYLSAFSWFTPVRAPNDYTNYCSGCTDEDAFTNAPPLSEVLGSAASGWLDSHAALAQCLESAEDLLFADEYNAIYRPSFTNPNEIKLGYIELDYTQRQIRRTHASLQQNVKMFRALLDVDSAYFLPTDGAELSADELSRANSPDLQAKWLLRGGLPYNSLIAAKQLFQLDRATRVLDQVHVGLLTEGRSALNFYGYIGAKNVAANSDTDFHKGIFSELCPLPDACGRNQFKLAEILRGDIKRKREVSANILRRMPWLEQFVQSEFFKSASTDIGNDAGFRVAVAFAITSYFQSHIETLEAAVTDLEKLYDYLWCADADTLGLEAKGGKRFNELMGLLEEIPNQAVPSRSKDPIGFQAVSNLNYVWGDIRQRREALALVQEWNSTLESAAVAVIASASMVYVSGPAIAWLGRVGTMAGSARVATAVTAKLARYAPTTVAGGRWAAQRAVELAYSQNQFVQVARGVAVGAGPVLDAVALGNALNQSLNVWYGLCDHAVGATDPWSVAPDQGDNVGAYFRCIREAEWSAAGGLFGVLGYRSGFKGGKQLVGFLKNQFTQNGFIFRVLKSRGGVPQAEYVSRERLSRLYQETQRSPVLLSETEELYGGHNKVVTWRGADGTQLVFKFEAASIPRELAGNRIAELLGYGNRVVYAEPALIRWVDDNGVTTPVRGLLSTRIDGKSYFDLGVYPNLWSTEVFWFDAITGNADRSLNLHPGNIFRENVTGLEIWIDHGNGFHSHWDVQNFLKSLEGAPYFNRDFHYGQAATKDFMRRLKNLDEERLRKELRATGLSEENITDTVRRRVDLLRDYAIWDWKQRYQ